MTVDEFNDKWKNHLEEGFEGLEFSDVKGQFGQRIDVEPETPVHEVADSHKD